MQEDDMTGSVRRSVLVMMACLAWGQLAAAAEPDKGGRSRASTKSKATATIAVWDKPTADYVQALAARARQAYVARLAQLTDEQLRQVLIDRFCMTVWWKRFDKRAEPTSPMVAAEWRKPAWEESCVAGFRRLRELLIPSIEQVVDGPLLEQRQALLAACAQADAAAQPQPPAAKPPQKSPTGLDYPALNRGPATAVEKFQRLERAVLVASSIADADSGPVLLENEQLADGLDVEEASAVQYMNERRLMAGSTALRINLLSSAAVRDHVTDMGMGRHNCVNHSSDKGDFFQRMARFGYEGATEGLGFGYNGPNAVDQQCYGGGHTVAVYSTDISEIGCGCHKTADPNEPQAVYGFAYGGSQPKRTPWYEDRFFLPPGLDSRRLEGAAASAYAAVTNDRFQALKPLAKRREAQPGQADATSIAVRFLLAYVELQIDHELSMIESLLQAGDCFGVQQRLAAADDRLAGLPRYDRAAAHYRKLLKEKKLQQELELGQSYHARLTAAAAAGDTLDRPAVAADLRAFAAQARTSAYAEAAETVAAALDDAKIPVTDALESYLQKKTSPLTIAHFP
jgi:uncharacterized protein YkwD